MEKSRVSFQGLAIDLPVRLQHIKSLEIKQSLDNHGIAHITGVLKGENQDSIHKLNQKTNVKIKVTTETGEETIFSGIPVKVMIKHMYGVYYMEITLKSHSLCLDVQKKNRSFQNRNNPWSSLFKTILREYGGEVFDSASQEAVQNCALIQYEETDWEFLKRAASRIGAKLFPEVRADGPWIYMGIPEGKQYDETTVDHCLKKSLEEYLILNNNHENRTEQEVLSGWLESRADYQLGDKIAYQKEFFTVAWKITEMKEGVLSRRYKLQIKSGLNRDGQYNLNLKGVSIEGKVLAVEKDKLKLHLSIDPDQNQAEARVQAADRPAFCAPENILYLKMDRQAGIEITSPPPEE
ncbi:contractile injection system protein, VgrG/Pvc8 family [Lachnospiraceae bacterium 54-53]